MQFMIGAYYQIRSNPLPTEIEVFKLKKTPGPVQIVRRDRVTVEVPKARAMVFI